MLNKTDLVDADTLSNVKKWIREVKPNVQIFDATFGRIPMEVLLGVEHSHESSPDDQSSSAHHHDLQFETWSYESSEPMNLGLLQQLLNHLPSTLFRAKGFVYAADKPNSRLLLQLVGRRAVLSVDRPWGDSPPQTRLVFIARSETCDFDAIRDALNQFQVKIDAPQNS